MSTCNHDGCQCKNLYTDWALGNRNGSCEDCGHLKTDHSRPYAVAPTTAPTEIHIASTREIAPADGIHKTGKNINVSLIFKSEDNLARFQSEVIELMSAVAGHKRPNIEVDEATVPHELVLRDEVTERISIADTVKLNRVFKYQYQHDSTASDPDNSAECDGYSDVASLKSAFGESVNIADPEVRCQMIEDPHSDYWNCMSPEAAHIKDKAKCTIKKDKTDPNNFIYMSRFLHCYFDGLNAKPPKFPAMKIHYVSHDSVTVPCSMIGTGTTLGLPPRHRVVVHIVFWDADVKKWAMAFLRRGGRDVDTLTYELDLHFQDANKAATFLNWKEEQTERVWAARRGGLSSEVAVAEAVAEHIGQGDLEDGEMGEHDTSVCGV